jgi:ankyrin repeat protein
VSGACSLMEPTLRRAITRGMSALFFAIATDRPSVAEELPESGVDVDARSANGNKVLTLEVSENRKDAVRFLLDHTADPNG